MDSLKVTDDASAAVAIAPRVKLEDIVDAIGALYYVTGAEAVSATHIADPEPSLEVLSICLVVMKNGFTIIGKSAPASKENFNFELGRKLAYEDAIRQIWPLMGFALRDKLAKGN